MQGCKLVVTDLRIYRSHALQTDSPEDAVILYICFCWCVCVLIDMSAVANLTLISTPLPPAAVAVAPAFPSFIPPASWPSLPVAMSPEPPSPSWSASDWPPLWRDNDGPFRSDQLRSRHHLLRQVFQSVSQIVK